MKTHSICHFYVNLILLVVGEYLKSILLQPTRGLFVLFNISRILAQDSTRSWLLLQPLKPLKNTKCLVKNGEPQFFLVLQLMLKGQNLQWSLQWRNILRSYIRYFDVVN